MVFDYGQCPTSYIHNLSTSHHSHDKCSRLPFHPLLFCDTNNQERPWELGYGLLLRHVWSKLCWH